MAETNPSESVPLAGSASASDAARATDPVPAVDKAFPVMHHDPPPPGATQASAGPLGEQNGDATRKVPPAPQQVAPQLSSARAPPHAESAVGKAAPGDRIQLIDEDQTLHSSVFQQKLAQWGLADAGFGYDICAVLGSQSTGKSTLLNRLFGTGFDVMDERSRKQTTRGIWLARGTNRNVLVMDVEGTDGRERGEDQDFERKSALFSLTTAECLIVNMWENQVGLYQGANMGLLKTVLDVNLSLFQAGRARVNSSKDKTLLLFVIRDYIGTTPIENLAETVAADLQRIWASLNKPEGLENARLSDFFDLSFAALPHKVLQPEQFDAAAGKLKERFIDSKTADYVFKPEYHKRIPVDGLPLYLNSVWDQVVQNKDLDLPTQQELLAQFRCDELAESAFVVFAAAVKVFRKALDAGSVVGTLGADMANHRGTALAAFDKDASRYHAGVYARKRQDLLTKLNTGLSPFFLAQMRNLHKQLTAKFRATVLDATRSQADYDFGTLVQEQHQAAMNEFDRASQEALLPDTDWAVTEAREQLDEEIQQAAVTMRAEESRKMLVQIERTIRKQLAEPVELALSKSDELMWDKVLRTFESGVRDGKAAYLQRSKSAWSDGAAD